MSNNIYSTSDFFRQVYIDEDSPILQDLAEFRVGLLDNGYEPVPVKEKNWLLKGWTKGEITPERVRDETRLGTSKLNTSLRCGRIAVIDNDVKDPEHAAAVDELIVHFLGRSPLVRRGSKGSAQIYHNRLPIKKLTLSDAQGGRLFEILGDGQQVVAYGRHPAGMDYTWIGEGDPAEVKVDQLPEVTPEGLHALMAAVKELLIGLGYEFPPEQSACGPPPPPKGKEEADEEEDSAALCRAALDVVHNDFPDRESAIKIGYAMYNGGLDFSDWDRWQRSWSGFKPTNKAVTQITKDWDSFSNGRSVHYRTLLQEADHRDPEWRSRFYAPQRMAQRQERQRQFDAHHKQFSKNEEQEEPVEKDASDSEQKSGLGVEGYSLSKAGLFFLEVADDGKEKWIWLSPPFEVPARSRDADGNWGKLLVWKNHDGEIVKYVMSSRFLGGRKDELWQALYERGLEISTGTVARGLLHSYLGRVDPAKRVKLVSKIGWHHGGDGKPMFVLPPDSVFGGEPSSVIYNGSYGQFPYKVSGTSAEWREQIGKLCVGNSRLMLAVSVAFAGPLLEICGENSGGFHYKGASRDGKTTATLPAASVWGNKIQTWRATSNGLEGTCENHSDTLLCLDEIGQAAGRDIGDVIYMIGNNAGKSRAARDGSAREVKVWRILFLSTGEMSISTKMEEVGKKTHAGQEVRLVEVLSDAGKGMGIFEDLHGWGSPREFAEHIKAMTQKYHGAPIRDYLDCVADLYTNCPTEFVDKLKAMRDGCIKDWLPKGASAQAQSVCGRFALVGAAGELATGMGLTGWERGDAEAAARTCFDAWVGERGVGDQELGRAVDAVIGFIEAHGQSRFADVSPSSGSDDAIWGDNDRVVFHRVGYRSGRVYFVFPQQWKRELCKGYDAKAVAQEMIRRGMMTPGTAGKASRMVRLNGFSKSQRFYVLTADIIAGEVSPSGSGEISSHKPMTNGQLADKMMAEPLSTDLIFSVSP